jgi:DNA-directed RNA polymerase subunit RPC12/RpoP
MIGLDGNAIAGMLYELYGQEMTTARGTCAHCHSRSVVAEVRVFRGAGTVLRCQHCGGRLMVIVERDGVACVDAQGFATLEVRAPRPVLVAGTRQPASGSVLPPADRGSSTR